MRRKPRHWLLIFLGVMSALYFLTSVAVAVGTGLDGDFSFFWTRHGNLLCFDTFEDNSWGNTLTLRKFRNWPAEVPLRYVNGAVEGGEEVPFVEFTDATGTHYGAGVGKAVNVWVDANNQPAMREGAVAHLSPPVAVTVVFQVPQPNLIGDFVLAIPWAAFGAFCLIRNKWRANRLDCGLCETCGYNLTGNISGICPECGTAVQAEVRSQRSEVSERQRAE